MPKHFNDTVLSNKRFWIDRLYQKWTVFFCLAEIKIIYLFYQLWLSGWDSTFSLNSFLLARTSEVSQRDLPLGGTKWSSIFCRYPLQAHSNCYRVDIKTVFSYLHSLNKPVVSFLFISERALLIRTLTAHKNILSLNNHSFHIKKKMKWKQPHWWVHVFSKRITNA